MKATKLRILCALPWIMASGSVAHAGNPPNKAGDSALENALIEMSESGRLGTSSQSAVIEKAAQVRYELGAVIDLRQAGPRGMPILAITPGGSAERMGLRVGDRLMGINGLRLDGDAPSSEQFEQAMRRHAGALDVFALRESAALHLKGMATAIGIPAYRIVVGETSRRECGYVDTESGVAPLVSEGISRLVVTRIDGRSTPPFTTSRYTLSAGKHVLTVAEAIDRAHLSPAQVLQIQRMRIHPGSTPYKAFVIDVKPGIAYRIGARLRRDKLDNKSILANDYWEPVTWQTRAEKCP